ncbi:MAG: dihydropteroate synthase [Nitrosopumilales archaeon CG15_BIG_FIL_POST_REV_8_21_14_020_37_12]|nr:MAG: dihydropteroate synthase [Nitrosopumilales archaeon CG15_BIG_FIL_POST_REV_8_21_14_020_37_12]
MNKLGGVPVGGNNPVRVMGILNTSPESFFKKSIKTSKRHISDAVKEMESAGADFVDIGGMSTAPYLLNLVSERTESDRVQDAIKVVQNVSNLPISIDTCRASVAKMALENRVEIINDISGLKYDPKMIDIISRYTPSMILCAFDSKTVTGNHVTATKKLLRQSLSLAKKANIPSSRVVLDPAIGFFRRSGKGSFFTKITTDWLERDLLILQNLRSIKKESPILVSVSNKSFIGKLLGKENPSDRLFGSIAAEVFSVIHGADIIRTHNVSQTMDAVKIASRLSKSPKRL